MILSVGTDQKQLEAGTGVLICTRIVSGQSWKQRVPAAEERTPGHVPISWAGLAWRRRRFDTRRQQPSLQDGQEVQSRSSDEEDSMVPGQAPGSPKSEGRTAGHRAPDAREGMGPMFIKSTGK